MALPALLTTDSNDEQLGQAITLLAAQINIANQRLLRMIAAFDRCGGWKKDGSMRSCAHWLSAHCGMDIGAAREKLRVARCLAGLPEVDQAFADGDLSYSKVRAITRVATPENQGFMVMLAEGNSASHLEKLVARYEPVAEPGLQGLLEDSAAVAVDTDEGGEPAEAPADEERQREQQRELYWFQDKGGMWVNHARLPPEEGQLVAKTLQAVARPLVEERQKDWQAAQKSRMQAVARKILARSRDTAEGVSRDEGDTAEENDATLANDVAYQRAEEKVSAETFSQHMNQIRADALVNMVEHFLASGPDYHDLQGLKGAERCQVVLHVDVNTLRQQRSGGCCTHGKAFYEDKPWLSPATARRLSCDTSLVTVLEDDTGQVLNVGRRSRVVAGPIRRALQERDGVCQYPGCHESVYVEAHHIKHWAEGGETSLDNLVTLCRFHHRQLHRGCFDVQVMQDVSAETGRPGVELQFVDAGEGPGEKASAGARRGRGGG
ncbi:HNH endonuclease [Seongchinamella unica]|uniref:HNH endonuclease n=1 Tax=Seongchinamella unica TaxID=2547392 RepID=A0A4R5LQD6_9GAMM|nr:HNH endonuclease signature motif containing protein [Seongchinamella unica]TDG12767.1 HNH endonuclease [Seongchinamella unica]